MCGGDGLGCSSSALRPGWRTHMLLNANFHQDRQMYIHINHAAEEALTRAMMPLRHSSALKADSPVRGWPLGQL